MLSVHNCIVAENPYYFYIVITTEPIVEDQYSGLYQTLFRTNDYYRFLSYVTPRLC